MTPGTRVTYVDEISNGGVGTVKQAADLNHRIQGAVAVLVLWDGESRPIWEVPETLKIVEQA